MKKISIVIPTLNEQKNIEPLVKRIDDVMADHNIGYEIIFVDDNSTDGTWDKIYSLIPTYPISLYKKVGKKGKAQSLIEGFSYAKYGLIAMIDADLQYPPEAIPSMIAKTMKGADIVVANRNEAKVGFKRRFISRVYSKVVAKLLLGLNCDVQSGLKVFKKSVTERLTLHPSPWAFDSEFLIKAKNAGYSIDSVEITFDKRRAGKSKVGVLQTSFEIGLSALKLARKKKQIIYFNHELKKKKGEGFHYNGLEFVPHADLHYSESAFYQFSAGQKLFLFLLALTLIAGLLVNWQITLITVVATITVLYFIDLLFNLFLIYRSFHKMPEVKVSKKEFSKIPESEWPTYTILCPLYKEWSVIPQFVTAMSRMDYPKEKLQVMLLLEEDDKETIEKVKGFSLPSYFDVVVVPNSQPKTKPKACNYGLQQTRGEYVVIYDAEDIPDIHQLKKAVLAFKKSNKNIVCIQAKLNFYNPHQNLLTRVFTAEYSLWFELVLTGLQSINAPIPLGGTSNHFKTADLKRLQGWDAFNVTEDCDLGIRLVKKGYRTAVIDSTTMEEANSDLKNWFNQRSRWIKGYMQTYLVHMRRPQEFLKDWKEPHVITFQLIVGGKILSMLINPIMWLITISYFTMYQFTGEFINSLFPAPVLYMGVFSLVIGNFLYLYYYIIGCAKREYDDLIKYAFLVPLYWLAMSIAAFRALYEVIVKPHYWAKTKHGLHLNNKKAISQAKTVIGEELVDNRLSTIPLQVALSKRS
jgi:glycosyltransferase XagB